MLSTLQEECGGSRSNRLRLVEIAVVGVDPSVVAVREFVRLSSGIPALQVRRDLCKWNCEVSQTACEDGEPVSVEPAWCEPAGVIDLSTGTGD